MDAQAIQEMENKKPFLQKIGAESSGAALVNKQMNNASTQPPISEADAQAKLLGESLSFDDAKSSEEINAIQPPQEIPPSPQDMMIQPDKYEGSYLDKRRNTGVAYFDKKEHLSLMDAYLAKQLGLNVSYVFHKMDIKSDNTHRVTNQTKSVNEITKHLGNAKSTIEMLIGMGGQKTFNEALKQGVKNVTFGAIGNTRDFEVYKDRLLANYTVAKSRGDGRILAGELEQSKKLIPYLSNQKGALAITKNILQETKHRIGEHIQNVKYSGLNPEQIRYYEQGLAQINTAEKLLQAAQTENRELNGKETADLLVLMGFAHK
ncbi:hypothetical protein LS68_009175 [Helicobacter sp. MIT 05-5293]|uniref:hypothetical protein n=1 Tax=unclassified Helicobacter TaxID=2593540 RepID=UPI00051D4239|nr:MULTISPECIES: hypothetical protein [unclassified Helicobacter]TLD79833.1 hypothetical protein LS68_009175 [Helicobacter sp. MIT 05-5293]TLD85452.1 hypothetical protein LS69_009480 [Helicobacter sp. MIT 05-5294]